MRILRKVCMNFSDHKYIIRQSVPSNSQSVFLVGIISPLVTYPLNGNRKIEFIGVNNKFRASPESHPIHSFVPHIIL